MEVTEAAVCGGWIEVGRLDESAPIMSAVVRDDGEG